MLDGRVLLCGCYHFQFQNGMLTQLVARVKNVCSFPYGSSATIEITVVPKAAHSHMGSAVYLKDHEEQYFSVKPNAKIYFI